MEKFGATDWATVGRILGRTGTQCLRRWTQQLDSSIKKTSWTEEEDEYLCRYVSKNGATEWAVVGRELGRTGAQCRNRWSHQLDPNTSNRRMSGTMMSYAKSPDSQDNDSTQDYIKFESVHNNSKTTAGYWTKEEDEIISQHVAEHGKTDWTPVSRKLNRSAKDCKIRWTNVLWWNNVGEPSVNAEPWTKSEVRTVLHIFVENIHRIYVIMIFTILLGRASIALRQREWRL